MREWEIKFTHEPTGESVTVGSNIFRSQHKARLAAMKLLKSKIYAKSKLVVKNEDVIANYDLPDDIQAPNDLRDYRSIGKSKMELR